MPHISHVPAIRWQWYDHQWEAISTGPAPSGPTEYFGDTYWGATYWGNAFWG